MKMSIKFPIQIILEQHWDGDRSYPEQVDSWGCCTVCVNVLMLKAEINPKLMRNWCMDKSGFQTQDQLYN